MSHSGLSVGSWFEGSTWCFVRSAAGQLWPLTLLGHSLGLDRPAGSFGCGTAPVHIGAGHALPISMWSQPLRRVGGGETVPSQAPTWISTLPQPMDPSSAPILVSGPGEGDWPQLVSGASFFIRSTHLPQCTCGLHRCLGQN